MTLGLVFFFGGLLQTIYALWAIRADAAKNHISLIEAAALKITDSEPLPQSRLGLAFDRVAQWAVLLMGIIFLAIGSLILGVELS
jgi:hypothetical protein